MKKIKDPALFEKIRKFLTEDMPVLRKKSPNTVEAYRYTLNIYLVFFLFKSTRHFPACSHNFPKTGDARFQGRSRLFCLLGKFPYLDESRRILMAVSSKTSSKTRFYYTATRRISSAAVQPSIWA